MWGDKRKRDLEVSCAECGQLLALQAMLWHSWVSWQMRDPSHRHRPVADKIPCCFCWYLPPLTPLPTAVQAIRVHQKACPGPRHLLTHRGLFWFSATWPLIQCADPCQCVGDLLHWCHSKLFKSGNKNFLVGNYSYFSTLSGFQIESRLGQTLTPKWRR